MPQISKTKSPDPIPTGFDVVCTIGRVEFGQGGDQTPYEAAFALIGKHGAEGSYSFPHENGATVTVEVAYPTPAGVPAEVESHKW